MKRVLYILGLLADSDIDWLISSGKRESVAAGEAILRQGEPTRNIYLITSGRFGVLIDAAGGSSQQIAELTSGEIVGEISLLDSRPPTATVRALAPSQVIRIPREALTARLEMSPEFASRFYRALAVFLAQRLRSTVAKLGYSGGPATGQLTDEDEIDPELLDSMDLAGKRFRWIMQRLGQTS